MEEYKVETRENGKKYPLPFNITIKAVRENINWQRRKGQLRKENKDIKKWGLERILSCRAQ